MTIIGHLVFALRPSVSPVSATSTCSTWVSRKRGQLISSESDSAALAPLLAHDRSRYTDHRLSPCSDQKYLVRSGISGFRRCPAATAFGIRRSSRDAVAFTALQAVVSEATSPNSSGPLTGGPRAGRAGRAAEYPVRCRRTAVPASAARAVPEGPRCRVRYIGSRS